MVLPPDKRVGLISQIPVYPAGYTVEDVLDTAFRPLREMEEEMEQLAARMERGEGPPPCCAGTTSSPPPSSRGRL